MYTLCFFVLKSCQNLVKSKPFLFWDTQQYICFGFSEQNFIHVYINMFT